MVVRRALRTEMFLVLSLVPLLGPVDAAELDAPLQTAPALQGSPRYFPRSDGMERQPRYDAPARPVPVGCVSRRAPVPSTAPDDPSYAGSAYGLGHPSYYGLTPPLGVDDPYGRALLPYCP